MKIVVLIGLSEGTEESEMVVFNVIKIDLFHLLFVNNFSGALIVLALSVCYCPVSVFM